MERLWQFFLERHGKPRLDDGRVLNGIVFVNRWTRWGERGVVGRG